MCYLGPHRDKQRVLLLRNFNLHYTVKLRKEKVNYFAIQAT